MKGRRANGEGTVYEFIQKIKKDNTNLSICETCKNCTNKKLCNNREDCKKLCSKCKNCTQCLKYCDRYYIYERNVSQATKKDGTRTSPQYAKKKKEAAKNNLDTLNKINNNIIVDKSKITLYEIAESIVEDRHNKNITNDNSYIANLSKLKRLNKHAFIHKPIQQVTDKDLHDFLNYMTMYSDSVIGKDYGLLNATFIKAVRKKIIYQNPLDDKDEFRKPKSKIKNEKVQAFTISQQQDFISAIKKTRNKYKYGWLLMLMLGLRPGEVYAINKNKDIDFKSKKIHIRTSLTHDKENKIILGDRTKTYSGDRFLDLNTDIEAILQEAILENTNNKYDLLFWDNSRTTFMSVQASNSAFKRFCQKNNIGKNFDETQYVLRHSYATRKIESGTPAEVLKDLLGHKDIEVTLNTYFDAFSEYKNKYNEKSFQYNKENNLNYIDLKQEEIIFNEINKFVKLLSDSSLDDLDKKMLKNTINQIKIKYNLLEEKTS